MSRSRVNLKVATIHFRADAAKIVAIHCVDHNIHREYQLCVYCVLGISIIFFFSLPINSLRDSKKHHSRRSNKNNQQISIITSDSTAINAHPSQMPMQQPQPHYDNRMNTQVKTYTDHGNGHGVMRTGNSSHYSKVRQLMKLFFFTPLNE